MKHLLLTALIFLLAASAGAAPELTIDQPTFDFGQVVPGATVVYRSWLRSVGEDTVLLTTVKTGCGCIVSSPLPDHLAPGDSTEIVLQWQTRQLTERKSASAFLLAEAPQPPVRIDLVVEPLLVSPGRAEVDSTVLLKVTPPSVSASESTKSEGDVWPLELANNTSETLVLALVGRPGDEWGLEFPDSIMARKSARLLVSLANTLQDNAIEDSFTIEARAESGLLVRQTISIQIGDFSFRPVFSTNK